MLKKTILILGAGIYQVPLINKSKEMGFTTVVASTKGNYPGINIADIFEDVDTSNIQGILAIAKKYKIDATLTTGTDVAVPAIGAIVDELGLNGTGFNAAMRSMNKVLMKGTFESHNIPTAKFIVSDSIEGVFSAAEIIGFPLLVKATDSSGSRGITMVKNESEISKAWTNAINISKNKEIIVEEYLIGVEYGAQAIIHGDEVVEVFLHNDSITKLPYLTPIGHSMPGNFHYSVVNKTKFVIGKAVTALGIRDTIANIDLMLVDNEPMIIEIGARMGATCLPEIISLFSGFDAYEHMLKLSLGEESKLPKSYPKKANAGLLLRSNKSGILKSIQIPKEILGHPSLYKLTLDKKPGDRINEFKIGPDRLGDIIVTGDSWENAEMIAEELSSKININII